MRDCGLQPSTRQNLRGVLSVVIEDALLKKFQKKYGGSMGVKVAFCYMNWKTGGEALARSAIPERTFYHYRRILHHDGFLTSDDIKSVSSARWIK
jgi:hypothetical protein